MRRALAWSLAALSALALGASASIYPVANQAWIPPFQHAEKIFATNHGPILARSGNSSVTVDVHGMNVTAAMDGWRLVVFVYHVADYAALVTVADKIELLACSRDPTVRFAGMSDVHKFVFHVANASVRAVATYPVVTSGWTDVQLFVCATDNEDAAPESLGFTGVLTIRNPYGLLPAPLYGMLPFSALLAVGYVTLDVFFAVLAIRHRQQLLQLHSGIMLVLVMGTIATASWLYAFYTLNETGEPVCCPYPTIFLVSVVLDALVRTLARILLLVVCLGYGIVRNRLGTFERIAIAALAVAYFASGVGDEVTRGTSSGAEFRQQPTLWSFLQLLCNLAFILWIHVALERILTRLHDTKQFAKRAMYVALAYALASFILFFTVLTIIAVCSRFGVFEWDVEWEWTQLVAWPVLNFIVSAAMCFIWRPTQNSSQFAFSMQLPMTDDGHGLEMTAQSHDSSDDDVDDVDGAAAAAATVENESDDDANADLEQNAQHKRVALAIDDNDDNDSDDGGM